MTSTPSPGAPDDSMALMEQSDLVSQTSHGPLPSEVASDLLREKLATLYPELKIDPDKTLIATPKWLVVNDQVETGPIEFMSLTATLVLHSLYGTTANYLEGEHFLTLESDANDPVHLAVSIEDIARALNDSVPRLFLELQKRQLDYWNHNGQKIPRWQELSDSLRNALNVQTIKGWDADECAMAREVFNNPDRATRKNSNSDLSAIQACLIDIDIVETTANRHLLIGGAVALKATCRERELLVMYTIERGYESFSSMEQLGNSLPARLGDPLEGRTMTWRLFEPDGNVFDHMAWALVSSQLDAIDAMRSAENPVNDDAELQSGFDETEHARLRQLHAAIPDWLRNASPMDIQDYSRYITALGKLYRQPEHKAARNEIPSITDYAQRLMVEAIIADTRAIDAAKLPLNELRINITNSFTADNFTLPNPLDHRTETLADFALENQAPYMATVSFLHDQAVPQWLTPAFLTSLAAQVDIGEAYPALIKRKLINEPVESRRQENFYCDQLRLLLPLLALEGKVKHESGIDEHGYRFVCELFDSNTDTPHTIAIYPLKLTPQHRLLSSSDTVQNMFLICPRAVESGPCLLYRPMQDQPLLQFPSRQNLLYALHQPGELRDSVLAWLQDNTRSYEYAQYVFPTGLPSPWIVAEQLVNLLKQGDGFGRVTFEYDEITGNVLSTLFKSNAQALVDLADRQSQSNAERRWSLLRESSWALFAVTSNFLTGAVGTAVWVWQTINEIQQAIDARDRGDTFIEWTSVSDLLLITGIILSHHAVMRRNALAGSRLARSSIEKPSQAGVEPVAVKFDPVPLVAELAPEHRSSLEVAGSVPRRTPMALGAYLDTFKVVAIDITDKNVTKINVKPPHLYQIANGTFAQVGERWFKVMVSGEGQAHIVDPDDLNRSGPLLTHDAKGQWFIDLRLRLRGGGGNAFSKPQVASSEVRLLELEAALGSFNDQAKVMETELSTLQTDIQKATSENFTSLSLAYSEKLGLTITAYQQALEKLREWRTLGGTKNYVYELLSLSTSLQKSLALWFVIKRTEYARATRIMTDTGQTEPMPIKTYVANIQLATDLSQEMVEKLELSQSTIEGLRAAGRAGIERAMEFKKLSPSFTVLDLKANELGMAQELCLEDKDSPLMTQARDAVGKIIVSSAKAAIQVVDFTKSGKDNSPLQTRIEDLDTLIETFADADQRLQELPDTYPDLVRRPRLQHLRGLIAEFAQLAQTRLQALLPEPEPKPVQRPTTSSHPSSSHQPAKVRKTRPKAPSKSEPGKTADDPLTPIAPVIRRQPASTLKDVELIEAAIELNLDTARFIERTGKDALRPRRIPADIQDVFDQQALRLEQSANSVDQALIRMKDEDGDPPPVSGLGLELRTAARRMREAGVSVRAALYKQRKPTQTAFKWLQENTQVGIEPGQRGRIQTKGMGDFFQEYRILDKTNGKAFWVAHFHYENLSSPADRPTAAHLKVADEYLKTLSAEQQTALNTIEPIDGVLRKLVDPELRKLFWPLEPKARR
ncbi:dermonecrotic toxin domain-containing protein [Pseudomonas umsongensis]|uniref:dermonecrotic toxin domain-containing protein n=1 Tax=Pseudomonas umsongensis TaxID=198618 RepID=UPI00200A22E3|nr:DUF6543 domain-containing protein [Pseudomonas umsongensis]MCK8658089.1 hypothetical protein [Pseudomonas umsongensis]